MFFKVCEDRGGEVVLVWGDRGRFYEEEVRGEFSVMVVI